MAGEKKKVKNKQNFIPVKKTVRQQINYTQQITSPGTLDVKNMNKSMELKKQVSTKKSVSRKSGCVSVKQTCSSVKGMGQQLGGVKYKQLLKRFDQLKGFQQRVERSKSKSLKQIREKQKSKSPKMKYSNSKKFNLTQLINKHPGTKIHYYTTTNHRTEFNSRMSLTNKLEKTLTKINQNEYFDRDGDTSLIPFISTSQVCNNETTQTILNSRCFEMSIQQIDDEYINIGEMRRFCRTMDNEELFESTLKRDIGYFRGDRYQMMATRIQRAWRRYCTKRLVDRYADVFFGQYKDRQEYRRLYLMRQDESSNSSLKYQAIRQENKKGKNTEYRNNLHIDSHRQEEDSYGIIYRVDHELQSSSSEQQQSRNNHKKNYSIEQYQSERMEQQQQQSSSQHQQQEDSINVLNSSVLYPENQQVQQERLVTYISNLDEDEMEKAEGQFKTIDYCQGQKLKKNNKQGEKHQQQEQLIKYIEQHSDQSQLPQSEDKKSQPQTPIHQHTEYQAKSQQQRQNNKAETDFIINQVKQNQLSKWNQIVQLLHQRKNKLLKPSNHQQIFSENIQQSAISTEQNIERQTKSQQKEQNLPQNDSNAPKKQFSGPSSQLSDLKKQEQFDSRKYIEYLDSDMYYELDKDKSSQNSQLNDKEQILSKKISFKKQKQLLTMLDFTQPPLIKRKVFGHSASKSQNLTYLRQSYDQSQQPFPPHPVITKHRLVKSMSEKNIQVVMKSISPQLEYHDSGEDDLNLELIRQQFLENGDTVMEFEKLHTSQQLRTKIKESLKNNQQILYQSEEEEEPTQPIVRVSIDLSKTFGLNKNEESYETNQIMAKNKQSTAIQLVKPSSILPTSQIDLEPSKQQKFFQKTEQIDKNIKFEENIITKIEIEKQKQERMQNVSFMVYNTMILEVLREIASYDSVLQRFKEYSLSVKQVIKQGKKGFQTNHTEVKSYVDGLVSYLLNEEPQVFKNLQIPAGPSALEMLHYMHPNDSDQMDEGSSISQDQTSVLVIPNRIFDKYWSLRQKSLKFDIESAPHINPQRKKKIVEELKNLTKMFYRSIFDTFNECLDIERNFGQAGKPYPWKKTPAFQHTKTLPQINKSIQVAQKRMAQIGTTYCGLIIEKNEMARISLEGSDDYIQHVQQDRMSRMLAQDLIEGEERWTFYDDEELQLLVQIGNFIVISLIIEAAGQVCQLSQRDI